MQIGSSFNMTQLNASLNSLKLEKSDATKSNSIEFQKISYSYSAISFDTQSNTIESNFQKDYQDFQDFLSNVGYSGKPIAELSQDEAAHLVSSDGFFGIDKTASRLADFVLSGGGNDEERLKAGRSGIIEGFKQAESLWGGKLPQISYDTIDKALSIIDEAMSKMGYSILNESV